MRIVSTIGEELFCSNKSVHLFFFLSQFGEDDRDMSFFSSKTLLLFSFESAVLFWFLFAIFVTLQFTHMEVEQLEHQDITIMKIENTQLFFLAFGLISRLWSCQKDVELKRSHVGGKISLVMIIKGHTIVWQIRKEIGLFLVVLRMFGTSLEQET